MSNLTGFAAHHASASAYKQPQTELLLLKYCLFPLSPSVPHCIYSILFHKDLPITPPNTLGPTVWTYLFPTFYCATSSLNKVLHFCEMRFTTIANNHLNCQIPHLIYLNPALHPLLKIVQNAAAKPTLFLYFLFTFQYFFFMEKSQLLLCIRKTYETFLSLSHLPNIDLHTLSFQSLHSDTGPTPSKFALVYLLLDCTYLVKFVNREFHTPSPCYCNFVIPSWKISAPTSGSRLPHLF